MFTDVNLPRFRPRQPKRLGNGYSLNTAYQGTRAPPSPSLARTKTRTRSLHDPSPSGWVADIVLVIMRIHMHREESLYICVYTHRYIYIYRKCTVLHAETRKETRGSRDPLLPSTFLFERQSRHAMIFHFPRHPLWNTSTPVVERGIEIDPRELEPPVGGQIGIDCLLLGFWKRE